MGSIKCPVLPDNITEQLIDNIDPESHCLNMYKYIEYNEKTLSYDNRPLLEVGQSLKKIVKILKPETMSSLKIKINQR